MDVKNRFRKEILFCFTSAFDLKYPKVCLRQFLHPPVQVDRVQLQTHLSSAQLNFAKLFDRNKVFYNLNGYFTATGVMTCNIEAC